MGIEIFGKHPDSRCGEYAVYPTAHWTALIACICELAPTEASIGGNWMSSACVDAESGVALANQLERAIAEGAVGRYIKRRNSFFVENSTMPCVICEGIGHWDSGYCNSCDGCGKTSTLKWDRDLYESDVQDFVAFVRHSGGFDVSDRLLGINRTFRIGDFGLLRDERGNFFG
jgi:hypothetical protein